MFINYRCEFLQSKKSSEEIGQYIQSYKGFVDVTVIYNSISPLMLAFDYLIISELEEDGLSFLGGGGRVMNSTSYFFFIPFFPTPTSHLAE